MYFYVVISILSYSFPIPFICSSYCQSSPLSFVTLLHVKARSTVPIFTSYLYLLRSFLPHSFPICVIFTSYRHSSVQKGALAEYVLSFMHVLATMLWVFPGVMESG
jgi:hypothetical protein